jgi:N-hydroxyarylamine O-acetyltransferase
VLWRHTEGRRLSRRPSAVTIAGVVDELLERIGLGGAARPAADADGLRAAHRAFLTTFAYDGLTAQLGEHAPLDAEALIARALRTGRGGYCFEINTVLREVLVALGFGVERHAAIVGPRDAFARGELTNHQALVAITPAGERFVVDAGWGEGPLEPLPLRPGTHVQGPLAWPIERDGDGWWVGQHEWGSTSGFRFSDAVVALDAFAPHHHRLATSPESSFVTTLVVQRPFDDHVLTLRARTLSWVGPARDEKRVVADEAELARVLRERFTIALDAPRVARLWRQARAQHEAFLNAAASA